MSDIPKYRNIMQIIRKRIEQGIYKPDTPLPSERALAHEFNTNHETVNKAISILVAEGLLFRKRGIGTFISDPKMSGNTEKRTVDILFYKRAKDLFAVPSFHEEILFTLQKLVMAKGFQCNIIPLLDITDFESYVQSVSAFVTSKYIPYSYIKHIINTEKPIIGVNFEFEPLPMTSVLIDNSAIDLLAFHLISNHHKNIGFIHASEYNPAHQSRIIRFRNFMQVMELKSNMDRIFPLSIESETKSSKLISSIRGCTALMAADDLVAIKLKHLLNRFNIRVPEDISITGFGNLSITQTLFPELSTADVDRNALCNTIVDTITDLLENENKPLRAQRINFSSHPIIRSSVIKI